MMTELVVVRAKVKQAVRDCNVSNDFAEALDKRVREIIRAAEERAKANNRRTVLPRDI